MCGPTILPSIPFLYTPPSPKPKLVNCVRLVGLLSWVLSDECHALLDVLLRWKLVKLH